MDCQTTCQDQQFETCENEFRANCSASCTGDGALFCDGEYVLSGSQLPGCAQALVNQGIGNLELKGSVSLADLGNKAGKSSCQMGSGLPSSGGRWAMGALGLAIAGVRRRLARRRIER
jgi:hypothetical protein